MKSRLIIFLYLGPPDVRVKHKLFSQDYFKLTTLQVIRNKAQNKWQNKQGLVNHPSTVTLQICPTSVQPTSKVIRIDTTGKYDFRFVCRW
jgi:hypothetical protein